MPQSDRSNSIWPNDIIITWHSWLVLSCIGSNELAAQHSNIWLVLAIAVCSVLQKPSTFPSSTCIDLLRGDSCMLYGGYFMCVICAAAVFLTCSQQHVVDVFQQQQRCRSITPKTRYIKHCHVHYHANPSESCHDRNRFRHIYSESATLNRSWKFILIHFIL